MPEPTQTPQNNTNNIQSKGTAAVVKNKLPKASFMRTVNVALRPTNK